MNLFPASLPYQEWWWDLVCWVRPVLFSGIFLQNSFLQFVFGNISFLLPSARSDGEIYCVGSEQFCLREYSYEIVFSRNILTHQFVFGNISFFLLPFTRSDGGIGIGPIWPVLSPGILLLDIAADKTEISLEYYDHYILLEYFYWILQQSKLEYSIWPFCSPEIFLWNCFIPYKARYNLKLHHQAWMVFDLFQLHLFR